MITRVFSIEGTAVSPGQHLAACPALACRAVGATIPDALAAITAQIQARWTAQLADLSVRSEAVSILTDDPESSAARWSAVVTVVTNETPGEGIQIEARIGLPFGTDVVTNLRAHLTAAASLAAYAAVIDAIGWYLAQPQFPARLRPALAELDGQAARACALIGDEPTHLRDHTVPHRVRDAALAPPTRN